MMRKTVVSIISIIFTLTIAQDDFNESPVSENKIITVTGSVSDANSGKSLAGANVTVDGTELGAATDENGEYTISDVELGSSISVSVIGYENQTLYADSEVLDFSLSSVVIEMTPMEVLASRASENTAVAYTDVDKEEIALRLGSRDIPLALNTIPSVYATGQGGGSGDARINVRGFNQRNVAVMINGIPVNDMENGWVYWSNWDGVADATSSIQLQKGLSAVNLATPSIGGSMNVVTDPTAQERRGLFKQEIGAYGFLKTTLSYHTGLMMDDKLALSATAVRKLGDGYVQGTWTDAWAYYFGASYALADNHRLEFYALGAPQRHGQNLYKQNIAAYDKDFALSIDNYNESALAENGGEFIEVGRDFNQNVAPLSEESQAILDAAGGQHWQMYSVRDGVDRYKKDELSERENFFHKPQVALNHYWTINEDMKLISSLYYSGGMGGGTGTYGRITTLDANGVTDAGTKESNNYKFYYGPSPWVRDWNSLIAMNSTDGDTLYAYKQTFAREGRESIGILRNSNNRQWTIGALSKLNYDLNSNLKVQVGLDWRTAQIYHVKTIRDLLGGEYFVNTDSDFDSENQRKGLGDPIDYNFTNYVNWLGFFAQGNYTAGDLTAFGMAGLTTVKYTHWNHFKAASNYDYSYVSAKDGSGADWVEGNGDATGGNADDLFIEADPISTYQFKAGVHYNLGGALSFLSAIPVFGKTYENAALWGNFGVAQKPPIFDQVIQDWDAKMSSDPINENFTGFEFGLDVYSNDGTMAGNINFYSMTWGDRVQTKYVQNLDGDDDIIYLTGINQVHSGIETEFAWQVAPIARIDIGIGFGNWTYTDNITGTYRDGDADVEFGYAVKDLKVGDMPQTNLVAGLTLSPVEGLNIQALYRYYDRHFSDWDPGSREYDPASEAPEPGVIFQAPSYGVLDLHANYVLPFEFNGITPQLYLHVFNALDEVYIQDAVNNSRYNGWASNGQAADAEVYFGLPTRFNLGLQVNL